MVILSGKLFPFMPGNYSISTDKAKLDIAMIHDFLSNHAYWAKGRSMKKVRRSIRHSICFGLYQEDGKQLGFARVVTDHTVFAWIMDVFIIESHRGNGLGKMLIKHIMEFPSLQGLSRWGLGTADAHGLYKQFGFGPLKNPQNMMVKLNPEAG